MDQKTPGSRDYQDICQESEKNKRLMISSNNLIKYESSGGGRRQSLKCMLETCTQTPMSSSPLNYLMQFRYHFKYMTSIICLFCCSLKLSFLSEKQKKITQNMQRMSNGCLRNFGNMRKMCSQILEEIKDIFDKCQNSVKESKKSKMKMA